MTARPDEPVARARRSTGIPHSPVNPFTSSGTASRYLRGRPQAHRAAVERAQVILGLEHVHRAIDVACGPGQSTRALSPLAELVVGVDAADEMVRTATSVEDQTRYATAAAGALPFADGAFDLVAVGSAVHWFDQERFSSEARRVLRPAGSMVVYEHFFLGQMAEEPAFAEWVQDRYLERFPVPPRGDHPGAEWSAHGFGRVGLDEYLDPVPMSARQLTDYLLSQSNTVVPVASGRASLEGVTAWLGEEIAPLFESHAERPVLFWGVVDAFTVDGG